MTPADSDFDVAIVGGGIIGAGIARDAACRGLKVALVDRADFGSGTTAASTRLIHGGLRYLAEADFRLVRQDLRERETLMRIAPHLVHPLPFILPIHRGRVIEPLKFRAGMLLYDALSFDKTLPSHRMLSAARLHRIEPAVDHDHIAGGALFYDAQIHSPERLTIENLIDAAAHGAAVHNYCEVTAAIHHADRIAGVVVRDRLTGEDREVRARVVVNASGPWFDGVAARLQPGVAPQVRMTKGVHVACDPFTSHAIVLEGAVDGRVVFAIPWAGYTWIGTTDTDFVGDPETAAATHEDVRYLIDSIAPTLPAAASARQYWSCAGVRALAQAGGAASDVSRMHRIETKRRGLLSIIGGKITAYRAIAEEVTDTLCESLGVKARCVTASTPLPGGGGARSGDANLDAMYGARAAAVRALASPPELAVRLSPAYPDIAAQVVFSVRHEWCRRLDDFLLRRSYLGFTPDRGVQAVDAVSRVMAQELGWPESRRRDEADSYRMRVASDVVAPSAGDASARDNGRSE